MLLCHAPLTPAHAHAKPTPTPTPTPMPTPTPTPALVLQVESASDLDLHLLCRSYRALAPLCLGDEALLTSAKVRWLKAKLPPLLEGGHLSPPSFTRWRAARAWTVQREPLSGKPRLIKKCLQQMKIIANGSE